MKTKILFVFPILLVSILLCSTSALSYQKQSFSKIYLSPFYIPGMMQNVPYNFTLNVTPPDNIKSVITAIIGFDVYMLPSVNFTITAKNINDKQSIPCNTEGYYISTTYSGAGQSRITFDCSNIINKSGIYIITLKSTKNTGSITGWLDLTYINNPAGEMKISGTEYVEGEYATIFLQLKDNLGLPVNNGNCYLDIFYPTHSNQSHPVLGRDIGMIYKNNSDGIYFFDMVIPNITGVYMLSAKCSYAYTTFWIYPPDSLEGSKRTIISGTYVGDTVALNSYEDNLYTLCESSQKKCDAYYDFNVSSRPNNITRLDLFYAGRTIKEPATLNFYVWNFTSSSWITLPNKLYLPGAIDPTTQLGINSFISNIVPLEDTISPNGTMRIRLYSNSTSTFYQYDNWLSLRFSTLIGEIQDLKGSGEMHVSTLSNLITSINQTIKDVNLTLYDLILAVNVSLPSNFTFNISCPTCNVSGNITDLYRKIRNAFISFSADETKELTVTGLFIKEPKTAECISNETLREYKNKTYYIENETLALFSYKDIYCEYGCNNNECISPPHSIYMLIIISVIFCIIIIKIVFY